MKKIKEVVDEIKAAKAAIDVVNEVKKFTEDHKEISDGINAVKGAVNEAKKLKEAHKEDIDSIKDGIFGIGEAVINIGTGVFNKVKEKVDKTDDKKTDETQNDNEPKGE
ncbi:MAG: hypothetical protein LBB93_03795 [Elusimicrobiota bacterium]|jgi:hypothetical protein|nr:hypothetical protein [Elusimicrobiota bacterium]